MKRNQLLIVTIAVAIAQSFFTQTSQAQDLFRVLVNTKCVSTNEAGELTHRHYGNREIIRDCAAAQGITNLAGLSLVYDRTADAVQVVAGTNHTVICTPLTFSGGVFLSNTNATKTERLAFVFADSSPVANGTLAASEHFFFGASNQLVWYSLQGQLQYAVPGNGTNASKIYNGIVVATANSFHRDGDDDDEDDNLNTDGTSGRHR